MTANLNEPPRVWGNMWWQNTAETWFELRTNITTRYAVRDAKQRAEIGLKPLLFLPVGQRPPGHSLKWGEYGPP